jgi:hypothetical protein
MGAAEAASEIAEIAADGVADGMHVVSEEALAAEQVVRTFDKLNLAWFGLGLAAGAAIGGLVAFRVAYRKSEAKYAAIADEEIAEMREHYNEKGLALEAQMNKGDLDKLVKEKGYKPAEPSSEPPLAVTPPTAVVERAAEMAEDDEVSEEPPDEVEDEEVLEEHNVFDKNPQATEEWDAHKERSRRSPLRPYVIHRDERDDREAYDDVTYTYYEADDVVCNERDEVMDENERKEVIGEENLDRFGHGSGDGNIVYVRNDKLEMDMEIIRSPNSYAQEVHGLDPVIRHSDRRGRRHIQDE